MNTLRVALVGIVWLLPLRAAAQQQPVIIQADTVLDGKGHILRHTRIVIEGSRVVRIDPNAKGKTYDLRGLTVLPGWIDTHVHITAHFGPNGHIGDPKETQQQAALAAASNAWVTLRAGFTTVQSVGSPEDRELRDLINRGSLPGPRLLTSTRPLIGRGEETGTPEQIRAQIKEIASQGANLIKLFASTSIREGGRQTLSQAQLEAACSEAKSLG